MTDGDRIDALMLALAVCLLAAMIIASALVGDCHGPGLRGVAL
jgi:hypothetical protein